MGFREWFLAPVIAEIRSIMADVSADLNAVANGLVSFRESLVGILAENETLRARNAELEGEDASESTAAAQVRAEFNSLVSVLPSSAETPDVEPVTPEDVVVESGQRDENGE